jgi:O-antigen/teichoic acid export membrane protein
METNREPEPTLPDFEHDLLDTPAAGPAAIRGSVVRSSGYIVGMLLSILSVSLLIRHLGFDDYGRYITVVSLVTIVQGVTDVGLGQIGVREFATRSSGERARLMGNLLGVRFALTTVGVLLAMVFVAVAGYGHELIFGALAAGVGMVLTVVQGTFAVPLSAQLRLGWVTAMDLLRQLLSVAAIVALVLVGAGLIPFLAVPVPVGVLVLIATAMLVRGAMPARPLFEWGEWSLLIRAVLPFAAAVAIGTVYLRITVVLVSLLATPIQTGYYATSFRVLEVLVSVPALTVGAVLPVLARAARDDRARLLYVLERLSEVTLIVGVWLGIALVLGARFALQVLAGSKGGPAVPVLQIQGPAIAATFISVGWQYGLLSSHRHRELLWIAVGALVLSMTLTLVLIGPLQARGAAIAFTSGEVAAALGSFFLLRRAGLLRLPLRVPLRVLLAAALAVSTALVPGLTSLGRALVASVIYFAILWAVGAIPAELFEALPNMPWRRARS